MRRIKWEANTKLFDHKKKTINKNTYLVVIIIIIIMKFFRFVYILFFANSISLYVSKLLCQDSRISNRSNIENFKYNVTII